MRWLRTQAAQLLPVLCASTGLTTLVMGKDWEVQHSPVLSLWIPTEG